jgi:hypothetical protein
MTQRELKLSNGAVGFGARSNCIIYTVITAFTETGFHGIEIGKWKRGRKAALSALM